MRWDTYRRIWNGVMVSMVIITLMVTYLVLSTIQCEEDVEELMKLREKLNRVTRQLDVMKQRHEALIDEWGDPNAREQVPLVKNEQLRRTISANVKELWYYISSQLSGDVPLEKIEEILQDTRLRKSVLLSDVEKFLKLEMWRDDEWRRREATRVRQLVQKRLNFLQNPDNCELAKKLYCKRDRSCDLGCQIHHIAYCLIFAYATERTLIFTHVQQTDERNISIFPVFNPTFNTCNGTYNDKIEKWEGDNSPQAVHVYSKPLEKFLPLAVPRDLGTRVRRFNGDPSAWWLGQILRFILKPTQDVYEAVTKNIREINFNIPIVGIHVRRTDKVGTEASFHHIDEYMTRVSEYYDQLEMKEPIEARRVYVATDDAYVLQEVRKKYPDYEFFGNQSIVESAAPRLRGRVESMTGTLVDLHLLSLCDYVVGTFSSQISRAVYEMMQLNTVDASASFYSLDDIYFFDRQNPHYRVTVISHNHNNRSEEITLRVGDLVRVAGNHWNGYGLGINNRTGERGLFPWYKTADLLVMESFPEYKQLNSDSFS